MKKYLALALLISTSIQGMPKSKKDAKKKEAKRNVAKESLLKAAELQQMLNTYERLSNRNQKSDKNTSANPIIIEIGSFDGMANPQTPNALSKASTK